MSIKILTKNSIDNTNIDGARQNHFSAGMKSGIVKGSLNEGRFFASASNIIALDTCELRISGHRVVIDSVQYVTLSNKPATPIRYSMIAEISVNDNSEPTFRLFIQPIETTLIQQNLFNTETGAGTYQIKIGNFTLDTNGEIQEVTRVVDIISGGGDGASADIEFNASAETISSDLQPEVNVDYNEETKKYDMHLKIPSGTGSKVLVGGVVQDEWNADVKADLTKVEDIEENVNKNIQTQINNLGNAYASIERVEGVSTNLNNEVTNRTSADNTLRANINTISLLPSKTIYSQGTISSSGQTVVMPVTGYFVAYFGKTTYDGYVQLTNSTRGLPDVRNVATDNYPALYVPGVQGDTITIYYSTNYPNGSYNIIKAEEV